MVFAPSRVRQAEHVIVLRTCALEICACSLSVVKAVKVSFKGIFNFNEKRGTKESRFNLVSKIKLQ